MCVAQKEGIAILTADNIWFSYQGGGRRILNGFSMSMREGECVGLSAPSGFGKTTLLKLLAGYLKPDSGRVFLDDQPIGEYKGYCPVQMIWQHPELVLNPRLKMAEVLKEAKILDGGVIEGLQIEKEWFARYPGELSGGELQRFCIARALGEKTRFILADEISTMLDLITQARIWRFLKKEAENRNIGLLAVSHSEPLLQEITSRRVRISE